MWIEWLSNDHWCKQRQLFGVSEMVPNIYGWSLCVYDQVERPLSTVNKSTTFKNEFKASPRFTVYGLFQMANSKSWYSCEIHSTIFDTWNLTSRFETILSVRDAKKSQNRELTNTCFSEINQFLKKTVK